MVLLLLAALPSQPSLLLSSQYEQVVDDIHRRVCDALQKLYDDHRAEYGWSDRALVIH